MSTREKAKIAAIVGILALLLCGSVVAAQREDVVARSAPLSP